MAKDEVKNAMFRTSPDRLRPKTVKQLAMSAVLPVADYASPVWYPIATHEMKQPLSQEIVSTKHSSFNVLGISLIMLLGGWLIVLDMGLEPLIASIKFRRFKKRMNSGQGYDSQYHPLHSVLE